MSTVQQAADIAAAEGLLRRTADAYGYADPEGVVTRHPEHFRQRPAALDATAGDRLLGDCRGCGTPVNDYRAHVWAERTCCPDCDHRPLPALRDVLAAAARDAEKAERFGHVISLTADWLTHLEALATGSSPLAQEVRRQAQALRRALDGTE